MKNPHITRGYAIFARGEIVKDIWTHLGIYKEKPNAEDHARGQGFLVPYKVIPVKIIIDKIQEVEDKLDGK
jgi:hypothetical protein